MRTKSFLLVAAVAGLTVTAVVSILVQPGLTAVVKGKGGPGIEGQHRSLEGTPFTVLPGWSAEQIAHALDELGLADAEEFLSAVREATVGLDLLHRPSQEGSLEGYLLPDTYRIFPGMTAESIVEMMVRNFQRNFVDSLSWKAHERGFDRDTLVSIAAAVEREAAPSERGLYASVLLNRLRSGLVAADEAGTGELQPQQDSGRSGAGGSEGEDSLTAPLGNPSLFAMNAVLEAPATRYLYVVPKPDGSHAFAETPEEYATLEDRYGSSRGWVRTLPPVESVPDADLQYLLDQIVETRLGDMSVAVKDLTTGGFARVQGRTRTVAAGLWHLPLLVAAFQARDAGEIQFHEMLSGEVGTVQDALAAIARDGDNEAAYALYERLGSERLQAVVKEMGLLDTVVDPQTPTRTSARDMVFLLEALASGNLLSDTSSDELRGLLLLGKGTSALGAHIPDTIPIAAKWGHLDDLHHDVGIVYTDKTAYVVAILTQEFPDREAASEALACVSRIIYDYLTQGIGQGHSAASTSDSRLTGFVIPVPGAWLPSREDLLPNAPRYYRFGIHEGVDFYNGDACVPIYRGTPVVAAKDGVVIRADHDYTDITPVELEEMLQRVERQGYTDPESLDRFGGRQVKIDHGDGVETVYSHLLSIEDGIDVGVEVKAGQMIGRIGNSGTPESVFDPEQDNHLHFEIRVDGEYLGKGAPISEVRAMLLRAFAVQLQ